MSKYFMPEADFESKFKKEKKLEKEIWPAT
jgi:hypothetical protein